MVAVAIVISIQTIGNILVLALLITPAAAARLLTDRLGLMMLVAPIIGAGSALVGLYLSWSLDLPAGGTIVLVATVVFLLAWVLAPRHGLIAKRLHRRNREDPDEETDEPGSAEPGSAESGGTNRPLESLAASDPGGAR